MMTYNVQRWRDNWYGDDHGEMTPHPEGEWVKYEEAAGWRDEAVGLTAFRVYREARAEAIADCIAAVESIKGFNEYSWGLESADEDEYGQYIDRDETLEKLSIMLEGK